MKTQIRCGVFETNSSSSHSVSVGNYEEKIRWLLNYGDAYDEKTNTYYEIYDDGYFYVSFGEFGWGPYVRNDVFTKLQYALTMVIETEGHHGEIQSIEDYYETEGFKAINELVKEHCKCDGVRIESRDCEKEPPEIIWHPSEEDKERGWLTHEGYIDHDSCECYKSLQDFIDEIGVSLEDFIFDTNVTLIINHDNR